ncbi:MAG: hypothetical protein JO114_23520 [Planctomycetaceae bacterium]|nr:hypothetical protein [Planctomycetaceae bacterium]
MTQRPKTARSRAARPTLEGLEARALLSDMSTAHAEVSAVQAHPTSQSILQNLTPLLTATTVAANGDNNPYGVAFIPKDFPAGGKLKPGDILVSDFNNGTSGLQATGVSIVSIDPTGKTTTFFQGSPGLGLNTALGVLPGGFIIVGNTPRTTVNGTPTVAAGSLLILDRNGNLVETLDASNPFYKLDGPWGLTIVNQGSTSHVFVSNVLNGTVTRIDMRTFKNGKLPEVMNATVVASGYTVATNAAALVVGPQGLAFDARRHVLYVASTADNAIFTVLHPLEVTSSNGTGTVFARNDGHLNGPLSLALAPNGHLLVTNGDAILPNAPPPPFNLILEYQPTGTFVAQLPIDNTGIAGGAFGLAIGSTSDHNQILAAVDDNSNSLIEWTIKKTK